MAPFTIADSQVFMKKLLLFVSISMLQAPAYAQLLAPFKDEMGRTKWQYVANFSSSVLILLLLITVCFLYVAHRRARNSNRELLEIKRSLERRVAERTANLQQANHAMEGEVAQHKETAARLQSSERYIKSILDSMPLMLIGLNHNMEITQWNQMAETTTGMGPDIVLGKPLWEAYPTITLSPAQVEEVLAEQKTVTIKHSQRGQYYFDITLYALQDQPETGLVILVDDITQQMKAENQLVQRDKMSAMGELASAMAHDIHSPLTTILNTLQYVQKQANLASTEQAFKAIKSDLTPKLAVAQNSGKQASAIIHNLLEFAGSHGDKKQPADIPVIMNHSLDLAAGLLSHSSGFNFSDITIEREYEPKLPQFPCFVAELQQVFLSLLRHAFHSICGRLGQPGYSPVIRLEIAQFYDSLWVKVQHNGIGLNSEEQMDVFEPFFSNTSSEGSSPVEQRLSFSYFIVTEHHAGQMAVTSDPDIGTTFHIQLQLS